MTNDRIARLRKFREEYFATAPADISQLAADAMIVVVDLETTVDRLTAALRAARHILMEEIETLEDEHGSLLTFEDYNKIWEDTGPVGKPNSVVGILDAALAPADPKPRKIRAEMGLSENLIIAPADPEPQQE